MFSKAKRFDYYPKSEEKPSPDCDRCLKKHTSFDHSPASPFNRSNSLRRTPKKNAQQKKQPKKIFDESGLVTLSAQNSVDFRKKDEKKEETAVEIHKEAEPISASSTPVSTSDELLFTRNSSESDNYDKIYEASSSKPGLVQHLDALEKKIGSQRQKIETLRTQFFSPGGDEGFQSSRSPSPPDLQERIKHVEDMSRICVKETLEFVTMYNKKQEEKCKARPQDYKELVEFCSDLIVEVSSKFSEDDCDKKRWKKVKGFCKDVVGSLRKIVRRS